MDGAAAAEDELNMRMDFLAAAAGVVKVTQILHIIGGAEIASAGLGKPVRKQIEYLEIARANVASIGRRS